MKKTISILLVLCIVLTFVPAFAKEGPDQLDDLTQTITETLEEAENTDETELYENTNTEDGTTEGEEAVNTATEQEIEGIIGSEQQEERLTEDEQEIVDELDETGEITKESVADILKKAYTYLVKRDIYYKHVITVLDRIEDMDNKALKLKAIKEFEKRYNRQKELDRKIHHRIEKLIEVLKANKDKFTPLERQVITRLFKPVLQKYYKHRRIIIHIHKRINIIKQLSLRDEMLKLSSQAELLENRGQYVQAAKAYEQLLQWGAADAGTIKKAGRVLKQVEGTGPKVFVEGERPAFDVKPQLINGRTMVPFRAIANALGVNDKDINWDNATKTITLKKGDKKIQLTVGKKVVKINGRLVEIDTAATIKEGRTLVPVRAVSEALDAKVGYDAETQVVTIDDNFGSEEQNIDSQLVNEAGMGSLGQEETQVTEQQVLDEVNSSNEASVQSEIKGVE